MSLADFVDKCTEDEKGILNESHIKILKLYLVTFQRKLRLIPFIL